MEVGTIVSLDLDHLIDEFCNQLSYEEMLEFISNLDMIVGDWDFTEMIYRWARDQHGEFLAEQEDMQREMQYR